MKKAINLIGVSAWERFVMMVLALPLYLLVWVISLLTFRQCEFNINLGAPLIRKEKK